MEDSLKYEFKHFEGAILSAQGYIDHAEKRNDIDWSEIKNQLIIIAGTYTLDNSTDILQFIDRLNRHLTYPSARVDAVNERRSWVLGFYHYGVDVLHVDTVLEKVYNALYRVDFSIVDAIVMQLEVYPVLHCSKLTGWSR